MSENPNHFLSDAPCKKCRGRTRYKSTGNCVPCAKKSVRERRIALAQSQAAAPDDANSGFDCIDENKFNAAVDRASIVGDDGSDLL